MASHDEDREQAALFDWAAYYPRLRWMYAIPNGGNRNIREARRLVAQGVKAGVSDIFLPIVKRTAGGHYAGLYIEMKRRKKSGPSRIRPDQADFVRDMKIEGYKAVVCYGAGEAIKVITEYAEL